MTTDPPTAATLASAVLWKKMQAYYQELGPDAWQKDLVPYQITTNKLLAHLYYSLIVAAIYDHLNLAKFNPNEPIYILELGAGHGKFSFYLCKFLAINNLFTKYKIIYVASDLSEKNINAWQQHPEFKQYLKQGWLDFAKFNLEDDQEIYLINTKKTIRSDSLINQLFVIANYIFDSLTTDAFKIQNHRLLTSIINFPKQAGFSLQKFKYTCAYKPVKPNYYAEELFNKILAMYSESIKTGSFLLPLGAFKAIQNLQTFSKLNTIFLVADKGNIELKDFKQNHDLSIAKHGSISFMVNFHAIAKLIKLQGGESIMQKNPYTDLQIACFVSKRQLACNTLGFLAKEVLYDINPQNLINLCYFKDQIYKITQLPQLLAILAIVKWDPDLFYDLSEQLLKLLTTAVKKQQFNTEQETELLCGLNLVAEYFFKLSADQDLPFAIANIYYALDRFTLAVKFFKISIKEFGSSAAAWYNIALCYYANKNFSMARKYANKAYNLDPKYTAAKKLFQEL